MSLTDIERLAGWLGKTKTPDFLHDDRVIAEILDRMPCACLVHLIDPLNIWRCWPDSRIQNEYYDSIDRRMAVMKAAIGIVKGEKLAE